MSKQYITGIRAAAIQYRKAIEDLRDEGVFDNDFSFNLFPRACCGDASDLLGQFFLDEGIQMWYVCGTHLESRPDEYGERNLHSHAWLTTADPITTDDYLIVDITGDQFNGNPDYCCDNGSVYVGEMDDFHRMFEFEARDVHPIASLHSLGFAAGRLINFYKLIEHKLQEQNAPVSHIRVRRNND